MKVKSQDEMNTLLNELNNISNIERDKAGNVVSFSYKKYYGTNRRSSKEIHVSFRKGKKCRGAVTYLPEKEFFGQLLDNYNIVTEIKTAGKKIVGYTFNGQKYKTDKPDTITLFSILEYKKFARVAWQRFWDNDKLLRNGYFSGLIGSSSANIGMYRLTKNEWDVYDVDINHCYSYNYNYPLPAGKFYTYEEYLHMIAEENPPIYWINFYKIRLKTIKNPYGVFIPLAPYLEYKDFDFLIARNESHMIISEYRKHLIDKVYGEFAYVVEEIYYCPAKIYLGLVQWQEEQLKEIDRKRELNIQSGDHKIAVNSLTGMFGRRDETSSIIGLRKFTNDLVGEAVEILHSPPERKVKANYLPLAIVVNDIAAVKLFYMLNDKNVMPLSWNTDGGVIAVHPWTVVQNSKKSGNIKSKLIHDPEFYYCSLFYGRPIILDRENGEVFNSKSIYYNKVNDQFVFEQELSVNTREGFKQIYNYIPFPVELWSNFNLRRSEIRLKFEEDHAMRKKMSKNENFFNIQEKYLNKLYYPFDPALNVIRRAKNYPVKNIYEKFCKKYFKNV